MPDILSQEQLNTIKTQNDARMSTIAAGGSVEPTTDTTNTGAFLEQLQSKLLGQADIVSSADTGIDKAIASALESTRASQEAGVSRIESQYGTKIAGIEEAGARTMTSAREAQRGFGVNRAALKQISDDTDSQVKEYEQMKQDALLQNNTQFAAQLSSLQLQALQFKQDSQQQSFQNMISAAGLGIQISAEERAASQFEQNLTFQKSQLEATRQSNMLDIAAGAGISIVPGETYESLSKRVANSDITRLQKEKLQADVDKAKAETDSNTQDYFANSIISREISGGANASDAASTAMFEMVQLYGIEPNLEQRNNIIQSALLQEELYKTKTQEELNKTDEAKTQLEEMFPEMSFDTNIIGGLVQKSKEEKTRSDIFKRIEENGETLTLGGEERDLTKLSEDIYSNLFGNI